MKTVRMLMFLLIFALLPGYALSATFGDIRLSYLEGDVQINSESTRDWVIASYNVPLYEGDRIWVPDYGKAELHFRNGTAVRLNEKTSADMLNYDRDSIQFYVNVGGVYANYRDNNKNVMQINTPVASIRAYDRAIFKVDVLGNGYTYVSVYRGSVYADYRDGKSVIEEGTMLLIRGYSREEAIPLSSPDVWTRWNFNRDKKLYDNYQSTRYLPEELRSYSYDFDNNGRWVHVKDYGYCWTPTVMVSAGWAPYRHGKWTWIRGDYIWVSYEPWGWTPYHYGRWAFAGSIGWFWVPPARGSVYWGPGYVGWVNNPSYVSWVPLAPGETYYGYGNYGPHSVNLINININKIVIKDKYKNARARDGVTVIHRDTFVTGRQEKIRIKENPFLGDRISVGRPDIAPEKRTAMPIIKDVPERKLPPREVKETDVRTLKEKFPLQRQRDSQMQDRMVTPKVQPNDRIKDRTPSEIRRDQTPGQPDTKRKIAPLEVTPEKGRWETPEMGRPVKPSQDRTPSEIRRDNLNQAPGQIQDPRPDTKKEKVRDIMPQEVKPDKGRQIAPPQDRIKDRAPSEIRRDNLNQAPGQIQDSRPDTKKEKARDIMPQEVKPDKGRQIAPPQDRIKDRAPSEIKRDNLNQAPGQIQDPRPDTKKEKARDIMPQEVKPDKGRQIAPPQEKNGKDTEKQIKQKGKDTPDEKTQNIEENIIRDRGIAPPRNK